MGCTFMATNDQIHHLHGKGDFIFSWAQNTNILLTYVLEVEYMIGLQQSLQDIYPRRIAHSLKEVQKLLSKTNGQVVGDMLTSAPIFVLETLNLEDAIRLLLETKYRRLSIVKPGDFNIGLCWKSMDAVILLLGTVYLGN